MTRGVQPHPWQRRQQWQRQRRYTGSKKVSPANWQIRHTVTAYLKSGEETERPQTCLQDIMTQMEKRGSDDAQCDEEPLEYDHDWEDHVIKAVVNDGGYCLSGGHGDSFTSGRKRCELLHSSRYVSMSVLRGLQSEVHAMHEIIMV